MSEELSDERREELIEFHLHCMEEALEEMGDEELLGHRLFRAVSAMREEAIKEQLEEYRAELEGRSDEELEL